MADVSSNLYSWSTTAGSNLPAGSTTIGTGMDDNLREIQAVVRAGLAHKGADIASATTTDLGAVAGLMHDITGTTTITSFGTVSAGIWKVIKFEGALTLTHNATSLILPGGASITTADGDVAIVISEGSGNWRCLSYTRANGAPVNAYVDSSAFVVGSADSTKKVRFEVDGLTTGTTRVITVPDADVTLGTAPSAAAQSDQETGTSTTTYVSPGRQHFPPSAVKAWALVTIAGGTPTLVASYNVSGITDNNVGDITITFTTALSSANYAVVASAQAGTGFCAGLSSNSTRSATNYRVVWIRPDSGAAVDPTEFSIAIYGDI